MVKSISSSPRALELALNAGADMIIGGNNAPKFESGRVDRQTIDRAYERVMKLKKRQSLAAQR